MLHTYYTTLSTHGCHLPMHPGRARPNSTQAQCFQTPPAMQLCTEYNPDRTTPRSSKRIIRHLSPRPVTASASVASLAPASKSPAFPPAFPPAEPVAEPFAKATAANTGPDPTPAGGARRHHATPRISKRRIVANPDPWNAIDSQLRGKARGNHGRLLHSPAKLCQVVHGVHESVLVTQPAIDSEQGLIRANFFFHGDCPHARPDHL